jgi:hypothetical protein
VSKLVAVLGSLLRLTAAVALLLLCWQDWPAVMARAEFEALPHFDYWKEANSLLNQERFSEALLVADAGLEAGVPEQEKALQELRGTIELERGRWMHRFQQMGRGVLTGTGESAEALGGAIVADLFVFGDVRDLVIQSGRKLRGEAVDPIIVGLSAGGILLTVNPAVDLGGALLKFARRMGGMTQSFARHLLDALKRAVDTRNADEVLQISDDVATLSLRARPAGALAILKHVDDPAELRLARQFSERPGGVFALWLGQKQTLTWLKVSAGNQDLMIKAARRGRAGFDYLARNGAVMLRAHPLLGLVKGLYKGNIPALLIELMRRYSEIVLGFAAGWAAYEAVLLLGRLFSHSGPRPPRPEPAPAT